MDGKVLDRVLSRITHEILEKNRDTKKIGLIGMQTRGIVFARRIAERIKEIEGLDIPVGVLDATLYRDDYRVKRKQPVVKITDIPFDINKKTVILVDDVLFTGRTVRAALDEIMDFGRPSKIRLCVLIDRGHRELPVRADYTGKNVPTAQNEEVRVMVNEIDGRESVMLVEVIED